MKKRVVLAGLNSIQNYGDHFIGECVEFLVEICRKETECVTLDLGFCKKNFRFLIYGGIRLLANFLPNSTISYKLVYVAMRIRFYKYYYNILKTADGLIFACGSFKYGTQNLWAQYSIAVECAEKLNIPVMFDAMNVQKYNADDWRCKCLRVHANYPCVKMITTRDGYVGAERLKSDYITSKSIRILPVGDPAFWIPECYGKRKQSGDKVGINLIRGDIYTDYGWRKLSEKQLIEAYSELIEILNREEIEWEFFTNGLPEDYIFGLKVLKNCGMEENIKETIVVPKDAEDLIRVISRYRGILGARLHACICAYSLDVPVSGFVWDEKMLHFAEMARLEEFFLDEEEFTGMELFVKLQKAIRGIYDQKNRENWKRCTQKSINEFLQLL
uniref:polysaccharide pyruvyl transferase family protein n=1 Tax=Lachnoclostridium phocaeense TaxID=1871021 RepID=UPI0026DB9CE1|nr:polysaccharide pyruvyl transferase family protein [Lachnoclostridium phocaeense]